MNRFSLRSVASGIAVSAAFATGLAIPLLAPEPVTAPVGTCSASVPEPAPTTPGVYDGDGPMPIARGPLAF